MARTAHHTPYKQTPYERARRVEDDPPYAFWRRVSGPHRAAVVYDLRYSTGELTTAPKEGRRPRPQKIRRSFAIHRYCRAHAECVGDLAHRAERTARSRTRAALLTAKVRPRHRHPPDPPPPQRPQGQLVRVEGPRRDDGGLAGSRARRHAPE